MNYTNPNLSPKNMPYPGTPGAPKTFDGNDDDIVEFLDDFENCADDADLLDNEKVDHLMRYLSKKQKAVFRVFDGYSTRNWLLFRAAIIGEFSAAFAEETYTRQALIEFTTEATIKQITTVRAMERYYREFRAIGEPLVAQNFITRSEYDCYFWFGLHEITRLRLEVDLFAGHPGHSIDTPHAPECVRAAGRRVFGSRPY